jgi:plastocyanin
MDEQAEGAAGAKANETKGLLEWPFSRFLMLAALVAELLAITFFVGPSPANAVFVVPFLGPILLLCGLALWKGRPWMYLGGGISLAIFPILIALFSVDSMVNPLLGIVFVAAMFLLLALFLGLPTGVWVFRHRKDASAPMTARRGLQSRYGLFTILVGGILLGAMAAGEAAYLQATSGGSVNSGSDMAPQANVTITAENFFFVPSNVSIPAGKIVEVTVVNKDNAFHTFTYTVYKGTPDEHTYSHNLLPSSTTRFSMLVSTAGTVHFWCVPHESMGMVGDFAVA